MSFFMRFRLLLALLVLGGLVFAGWQIFSAPAAEELYKTALAMAEKDPAGAIEKLEEAIKADKNHVPSYLALAELTLTHEKDLDGALEYCDQAEALAPSDPRVPLVRAKLLLLTADKDNVTKAVTFLRKTIALEPGNAEAHWLLGRSLLLTGSTKDGLAECDKAIELQPDNVDWLVFYGETLIGEAAYDRAERMLKQALRYEAKNFTAHYDLALLYQGLKKYDQAITEYKSCLEVQPNNVSVMANLGASYIAEKDYALAITWCKRAVDIKPDYALAWYNLACAYALKGDTNNALMNLEKALALEPKLKKMAAEDPDLESLKKNKKFQEMVK